VIAACTRAVARLLALLPWFALIGGPAAGSDWNTAVGRDPGRTGLAPELGPSGPDVLWQGGRTSVIAQQALAAEGILVSNRMFSLSDVQNGTLIVAQDLSTGDELWTANLPWDAQSPGWRNKVSAFRGGRIYATRAGNTSTDYLYALDPLTGGVLWTSEDKIGEETTESLSFAEDGDLIAGNFDSVMRIEHLDGTTRWRTPRTSPTSNGSQVAVHGNRVYLWEASPQGPKVTAFDLTTGERLYSSPAVSGGLVQQVGLQVGPDGTVYAPRTQNNAATDFLVAYADNGSALSERWRVPLGYVPFASFGFAPDGSVMSYSPALEILRLDSTTGGIIDTSLPLPGNFPYQPRMAVDGGGNVYVTNGGFALGKLFALAPDLSFRWSTDIPNVNLGGPVLAGDGILVVCGVGTDVRAFRTAATEVAEAPGAGTLRLLPAYPNPFHSTAVFQFDLPHPTPVQAEVLDPAGRVVVRLLAGDHRGRGRHELRWDGRGSGGEPAPSGVYFFRLEAAGTARAAKILRID
jgi:outer membrane protein assembly factor BamB